MVVELMDFKSERLVIIGFGNQAKAWAQNLRDSGFEVAIYLRADSKSRTLAQELNFNLIEANELKDYHTFALLIPDEAHHAYINEIKNDLPSEACLLYAHGFSLLYQEILQDYKEFNHVLHAPKAIASELRFQYECKGGLGGVYSLEHVNSNELREHILNIGSKLGLKVLHESTCEQETIADLFSEQSILCSIIPYAAAKSFNKLIENGIDQEVAYFECWYEVKLIVDTLIKIGPYEFFKLISPNALLGSEVGKSLFFDMEFEKKMEDMFHNIKSGNFVKSVQEQDISQIKNDVLNFWKDQKINNVHSQLKEKLFN